MLSRLVSVLPLRAFMYTCFNQNVASFLTDLNSIQLKEYSLILTSFYDMNQKMQALKAYFRNFSRFQFSVNKLCTIMCTGIAPQNTVLN